MSILDPTIIRQFAEDLPRADLLAIVSTFMADLERLTEELAAACQARDARGFHRAAHSLAGAAAAVGALALEQAARVAMAAGESPNDAMVTAVRASREATIRAIEALMGGAD